MRVEAIRADTFDALSGRSRRAFWDVTKIAALAAVYFCAGKLGLRLAFVNQSATAVWPPTGIALAAILLWGYRVWPGIWLGAFLVNLTTAGTVLTSLGIAGGNTLEALLGAWLIERFAHGRGVFDKSRDILRFILLAVVLSTMVSATVGVTSLKLGGFIRPGNYFPVWTTWWLGNAISALIITPLIVIWAATPFPRWQRRQFIEAGLILIVISVIGLVGFGGPSNAPLHRYPRFLLFPVVMWTAYRFTQRGAITAITFLSFIAIWGTLRGFGPFASDSANESLLLLQIYIGSLAITNLVLGAVVSERQQTEDVLRETEEKEQTRLIGNLSVTRILAESPALANATPRILETVCATLGWEVGGFWTRDLDANVLRCLKVCHAPGAEVDKFEAITRTMTFAPGIGLPGRVWKSRLPAWIPDVTKDGNFPRAPFAVADKLHAAFAFPILFREEVLGVMEFFSREIREPDEALLAMFGSIGSQIGQFMERKRAEEGLRAKEAELRLVTDMTPVMLARCSRDLRYVFVNRAYAKTLNCTPEQLAGRPILEIMGEKGFETIRPRVEKVLQGESAEYEDEVHFAGVGPRWLRVIYLPDRDEQSNVVGWIASINDITEQKRSEVVQCELAAIVQSSNDAIVSKNLDGIITSWNAAAERLFGYAPQEVIGQSISLIIPPERQAEERSILALLRRGEHVEHYETIRVTKDGRRVPVSLTISPIKDNTGTAIGASKIARDITDRKLAEESIRKLNEELEQRVVARTAELSLAHQQLQIEVEERKRLEAEIARAIEREQHRLGQELHEGLGQKLTGISYMLTSLQGKLKKASPVRAREASKLEKMMLETVDQTRHLAKGFYPVELQTHGLLFALEDFGHNIERLFGTSCVIESDQSACTKLKDSLGIQLFRIVQEAVRNAVKHAKANRISIHLATIKGDIILTVRDDGIGLPAEIEATKGMGLRIMQYRTRLFGGEVNFRNAPDGGTIVTCSVPSGQILPNLPLTQSTRADVTEIGESAPA